MSNWAIVVGKVRLNFGKISLEVRLVLVWSGIWSGKLIFLKIIFEENFVRLKNVIWIYSIYIYSRTPLARAPTGRHSIGRVNGAGMVASHLHSLRGHVSSRSLHFYNSFLDWELFSFVLRAADSLSLLYYKITQRK